MSKEKEKEAIKKAKSIYSKLEELQKEWDIYHKNGDINKSFWAIDRKINKLWKEANRLPFCAYSLQSMDDLLGYIEFRELCLEDNNK